jgi:hypothetical protein
MDCKVRPGLLHTHHLKVVDVDVRRLLCNPFDDTGNIMRC